MLSEDKLLQNPAALCNMVRRVALAAGEITLEYYELAGEVAVDEKADGSPVSEADKRAEKYIIKQLGEITPGIPVIGEETAEAGNLPDLSSSEYVWLVDPLDGTREFLSGGADFTVNIGLIRNERPVLGVVHVPVSGVTYAGHGPETAVRRSPDTGKDRRIYVRRPPERGLTAVASKSHGDADQREAFLSGFKIEKLIKRGSSLKICVIAEGRADLYPRFGPTGHWDTAAAHAVLSAAGGYLTDMDGRELRYSPSGSKFLNPEFVASSFSWNENQD